MFVQYLAALAIVEGIQSYDRGYRQVPVKLKWPNDICKTRFIVTQESCAQWMCTDAEDPTKPGKGSYVKIGGILVNSSYSGSDYYIVVG